MYSELAMSKFDFLCLCSLFLPYSRSDYLNNHVREIMTKLHFSVRLFKFLIFSVLFGLILV